MPNEAHRPAAHVAGLVDVRLKQSRAAWLRVELRKIESLPDGSSLVDLVGEGPLTVWEARSGAAVKAPDDAAQLIGDDSAPVWEHVPESAFPFSIPLPCTLPPSARLGRHACIRYELGATLCVRQRRALLKKKKQNETSALILASQPITIVKHDTLPRWPRYTYPEEHRAVVLMETGSVLITLFWTQHCHGPGDRISATVTLTNKTGAKIKPKNMTLALVQTVIFKIPPQPAKSSDVAKQAPERSISFSTSPPRLTNVAVRKLAGSKPLPSGERRTYDMSVVVPKQHALMTINTARYIDVAYVYVATAPNLCIA